MRIMPGRNILDSCWGSVIHILFGMRWWNLCQLAGSNTLLKMRC